MWTLYLTAKTYSQRPSDLVEIDDRWVALQFDNAVTLLGTAIENASQEMEERGTGDNKKYEPKYTMKQLLDPDFRFKDEHHQTFEDQVNQFRGVDGINYSEVS